MDECFQQNMASGNRLPANIASYIIVDEKADQLVMYAGVHDETNGTTHSENKSASGASGSGKKNTSGNCGALGHNK